MTLHVDLYLWRLDPEAATLARRAAHLSEDEAARAARFVRPRDGNAYRAGRGRLREILGELTGVAPSNLRFDYGPEGKPALPGGPLFNLSHTGPYACLAVSADTQLGLDIEQEREIEDDVARRFFSPTEYAALSALPVTGWRAGFYRCWTRKEALVKALGGGLSIPLDAFDVTLDAAGPPRLTRLAPAYGTAADWALLHLRAAPGVPGALALRSMGRTVTTRVREGGLSVGHSSP